MRRPKEELTPSKKSHIEDQLNAVRYMVRQCSEDRMPQGPCSYCLEIYRTAINKAIDLGVYD